jgi:hypothetical protein
MHCASGPAYTLPWPMPYPESARAAQVHHLGFFTVERNAARMYDRAVAAVRGPGAPTNCAPGDAFSSGDEREVQRNLALLAAPLGGPPGGRSARCAPRAADILFVHTVTLPELPVKQSLRAVRLGRLTFHLCTQWPSRGSMFCPKNPILLHASLFLIISPRQRSGREPGELSKGRPTIAGRPGAARPRRPAAVGSGPRRRRTAAAARAAAAARGPAPATPRRPAMRTGGPSSSARCPSAAGARECSIPTLPQLSPLGT